MILKVQKHQQKSICQTSQVFTEAARDVLGYLSLRGSLGLLWLQVNLRSEDNITSAAVGYIQELIKQEPNPHLGPRGLLSLPLLLAPDHQGPPGVPVNLHLQTQSETWRLINE